MYHSKPNSIEIIIINIKDWALWSVPSPKLQLLSPKFLRSSNCSPSLWSAVVWFQRDSVLWHSLQVLKPVPSVFIFHRHYPNDFGVQTHRRGNAASWVTRQLALRKANLEGPSTTGYTQAKLKIRLHVTPCWRMHSHDASWQSTVPTAYNVLTKIRDSLNPEQLRTARRKKGITPHGGCICNDTFTVQILCMCIL